MVSDYELIWRLVLSALLGGLLGLEREAHGRAAGLRTHILVSVGSALIMLTSMHIFDIYRGEKINIDPARIAAQEVSGIGFLGAGTILRFRASVIGLTTAASLWAVAGIGLAVGCGFTTGALVTTEIALITLFVLTRIEKCFIRRDWYRVLSVTTRGDANQIEQIRAILSDYNLEVRDFEMKRSDDKEFVILEVTLKLTSDKYDDVLLSDIMRIKGIDRARWI
ncbi:MAG: MgtC/SapB family protein [Candidatus Omnitrophica bacterium]|nr:MgtC/SapB family protein [Candidatus Omnitrophota bacterium]